MAIIDNYIKIAKEEINSKQLRYLKKSVTFRPTNTRVISVYRESEPTGLLWLPRGALDIVREACPKLRIEDRRSFPKMERLAHKIELDYSGEDKSFEGQLDAFNAIRENKQGRIIRQPGTGKTTIGLYTIAEIGTRWLVIVHTEELMDQWLEYAERYIPRIEVGVIKQRRNEVKRLSIATVQTLYRRSFPTEWYRQFGGTILDECHHGAAETLDDVISQTTSRYRLGFTASETRADKMEPLTRLNIGPIIHKMEFVSQVPVTVEKLNSNFGGKFNVGQGPEWMRRKSWHRMIDKLISDQNRNAMIAKAVDKKLSEGRSCLVLSRRIEHLQNIQELLKHDSVVLAAQLTPKLERKKIVQQFRSGKIKCVLATQLADEGLDVPILSCVVLVFPAKFADKLLQQVGRALREHERKEDAVIIDVVDPKVKTLRNQWFERRKAYTRWRFDIKGTPKLVSSLQRAQLRLFD